METFLWILLGVWVGIGLLYGGLLFAMAEVLGGDSSKAFLLGFVWPMYVLFPVFSYFFPETTRRLVNRWDPVHREKVRIAKTLTEEDLAAIEQDFGVEERKAWEDLKNDKGIRQ